MSNCYICGHDKNSHINGICPPAIASACSAVDGGTSGCGAPAEIRSVAAGRQVTEVPCVACSGCGLIWGSIGQAICRNCKGTGVTENTVP